jgi:hypothetical protein
MSSPSPVHLQAVFSYSRSTSSCLLLVLLFFKLSSPRPALLQVVFSSSCSSSSCLFLVLFFFKLYLLVLFFLKLSSPRPVLLQAVFSRPVLLQVVISSSCSSSSCHLLVLFFFKLSSHRPVLLQAVFSSSRSTSSCFLHVLLFSNLYFFLACSSPSCSLNCIYPRTTPRVTCHRIVLCKLPYLSYCFPLSYLLLVLLFFKLFCFLFSLCFAAKKFEIRRGRVHSHKCLTAF